MNAQPTSQAPKPIGVTSVGLPLDPGHGAHDTHLAPAGVEPLASAHRTGGTQTWNGAGEPSGSTDHRRRDTHIECVGTATLSSQPPTNVARTQPVSGGWLELRIWAEMFEDAQKARIAATNRAERGGVDPTIYEAYLERLRVAEHECGLAMRRCLRRVAPQPIIEWATRH